jgi:ParB family transcriptional regulator, chromosome partitioning protein
VTKDRRLGRGLAALLGSPMEEDSIVEGTAKSNYEPASQSSNSMARSVVKRDPLPETERGLATKPIAKPTTPTRSIARTPGVTGAVPLNPTPNNAPNNAPGRNTLELSVYDIDNNPFQPRRKFNEEEIAALGESIREHEQLQPILVRRVGTRFQLISGERRLRATIHAGLKTIRAEVREADDRLVAELAIVENLQRKDLDAIEKALSFRRYIDEHQCKQDDLARRLKIDRSTIANLMRLLELPEQIQQWIQNDSITAGHARALLPLGDEKQQLRFATMIKEENWNVRETESRVAEQLQSEDGVIAGSIATARASSRKRTTPQIAALEQQLRLSLGTKTEIRQSATGRGKISITFTNNDEFERICSLICPQPLRKTA